MEQDHGLDEAEEDDKMSKTNGSDDGADGWFQSLPSIEHCLDYCHQQQQSSAVEPQDNSLGQLFLQVSLLKSCPPFLSSPHNSQTFAGT